MQAGLSGVEPKQAVVVSECVSVCVRVCVFERLGLVCMLFFCLPYLQLVVEV